MNRGHLALAFSKTVTVDRHARRAGIGPSCSGAQDAEVLRSRGRRSVDAKGVNGLFGMQYGGPYKEVG